MAKIIKMLPFLMICELAFLLTAIIGFDTGGLIFLLFIIIPIWCFVISVIYALINQFCMIQLLFPLFVGILFAVTFLIFFKDIVWINTVFYVMLSFVGNGIGYLLKKLSKHSK